MLGRALNLLGVASVGPCAFACLVTLGRQDIANQAHNTLFLVLLPALQTNLEIFHRLAHDNNDESVALSLRPRRRVMLFDRKEVFNVLFKPPPAIEQLTYGMNFQSQTSTSRLSCMHDAST
ncbi:hypothetical protein BCR43DRAFT_502501 [Syncephalastrum racemosum]|uniref:Secreted protein n=1 Tax=Syncephalastrum racemosum TaxID=13706 RepID=A0A1X2HN78_SYNRA|nr:hypothetical protein BCR43DRAFT_502501 [Syncephalastrum racemosum]